MLRLSRKVEAEVRATGAFLDGVMAPDAAPCMSGKPAVPATLSPPLSGDVLRAYDNYQKQIAEAAAGLLAFCSWGL